MFDLKDVTDAHMQSVPAGVGGEGRKTVCTVLPSAPTNLSSDCWHFHASFSSLLDPFSVTH